MEWQPIETAPLGKVVDTIVMDSDGGNERHHQPLKASQRDSGCRVMWWFPDGSMYVYYAPTHWKPLTT